MFLQILKSKDLSLFKSSTVLEKYLVITNRWNNRLCGITFHTLNFRSFLPESAVEEESISFSVCLGATRQCQACQVILLLVNCYNVTVWTTCGLS